MIRPCPYFGLSRLERKRRIDTVIREQNYQLSGMELDETRAKNEWCGEIDYEISAGSRTGFRSGGSARR